MTIIIGLTGIIGSGKSTVARLLHKYGAPVINMDKIGHDIYRPGTIAWNEIVHTFGRYVLTADGEIDRTILGQIVFNDEAALDCLNIITHPRILEIVDKLIADYRRNNTPVLVIEAPLLIDVGWQKLADEVWVVTASKAKVAKRLQKTRGLTENEVNSREQSRLPEAELLKYADIVINNNGSREYLKKQVATQWARLTQNKG